MKIYNTERPLEVPRDLNLTELLHGSALLPPSHILASDSLTNRSITLGELRSRAGRLASGIVEILGPHDQARWALVLPNSVEFLETVHAILWTGGVVCPINHALKSNEIGHGLSICRPQYIVVYGEALASVQDAIRVASRELHKQCVPWEPPTVLTAIGPPTTGQSHLPDDFMSSTSLSIPHNLDTSKRVATIHLSSGTTGNPKGVVLTHRNFVANVLQLLAHDSSQFHQASRTVSFTPWAHIAMTTMPLFLAPYTGMFHHAMPSYNLEQFAKLVGSVQATSFQGVPSVVLQLAKSDVTERHDFSRAAILNVGGAPLKRDDLKRLMSRYVAYQQLDETVPEGSTGRLLPGIEARLVKEDEGADSPQGGPGELWLRGPNITSGYAFNDEANRKAFPEPGWYNTGDVCTIDSGGRLSIVGRTKDLIKYKGFQVSPQELEAHLNSHPDVAEAGAAALWDETQLTELPTAWVILKPHVADMDGKERRMVLGNIQSWFDTQVSGYKKLRGGVWEVAKLPKNATGKILRKEMTTMREGLCSLSKNLQAKL